MLHFAYGSNMSRALMAARCPGAEARGPARLAGWRFLISRNGYASIAPASGAIVHGVLWRLGTRDLAAINAYEAVDAGLYLRRPLRVRLGDRSVAALVYIARAKGEGRPKPGYIHVIVEGARDWQLPAGHIRSLQRWSSSGWRGVRPPDTGEIA